MASMRDIKRRKDSIQSTGQITKAMKLVATVKLQKAKSRAEESKPYFNYMYDTVTSMQVSMQICLMSRKWFQREVHSVIVRILMKYIMPVPPMNIFTA